MGTFFHPITIIGPNGEETVNALVDPDVLFATVPAELLSRLGVTPFEHERFRARSGSPDRAFGQAQGRLAGREGHLAVIFGEDGDPARIGEHTLTGFILEADLEEERLVDKVFHEVRHF